MDVVLVWQARGAETPELRPAHVAERLRSLFAPLFETPPATLLLEAGGAHVAALDMAPRGWKDPAREEADGRWALAISPPLPASAPRGEAARGGLLATASWLERDPSGALAELPPPFALAWSGAGALHVRNDALGMAQLLEAETPDVWALASRPLALRALGLPLEPVASEWALWATLGWFPFQTTGFRGVRHVEPGTLLTARPGRVERARLDALRGWVAPPPLAREDALELGHGALRAMLAACVPRCEGLEMGLTGGHDSRAVVAAVRGLGLPCSPSVRGLADRPDVVIARKLAAIAGLPLVVRGGSGTPSEDTAGLRRSLERGLLWAGGQTSPHRAATFLVKGWLRRRAPSVTGQHGELARRLRALLSDGEIAPEANTWSADETGRRARASILADIPECLRPEWRDTVARSAEALFAQADRYGLEGMARLDFFTLFELTRRKGGALHAWQPRVVIAPFLAPGAIRAVFSVPGGLEPGALHRYILARDAPDWAGVPYADELPSLEVSRDKAGAAGTDWRRPWLRENYDRPAYWASVGRPLGDEALEEGGFWQELFDPEAVRRRWPAAAERVALLHLLPRVVRL